MSAPMSWLASGLCAQTDPAVFFLDKGGSPKPAKRICARCEVSEQCREWALQANEQHGIWGGLAREELRKIRVARGMESAP